MKLMRNEWLRVACRQLETEPYRGGPGGGGIIGNGAGQDGVHAQPLTTTTVQGTPYMANGQDGLGNNCSWSWPPFTTANGQAVVAGNTTVAVGSGWICEREP